MSDLKQTKNCFKSFTKLTSLRAGGALGGGGRGVAVKPWAVQPWRRA